MRLNELSLRTRLGLGFGAVLLLTALIALGGWLQLNQSRNAIEAMTSLNRCISEGPKKLYKCKYITTVCMILS